MGDGPGLTSITIVRIPPPLTPVLVGGVADVGTAVGTAEGGPDGGVDGAPDTCAEIMGEWRGVVYALTMCCIAETLSSAAATSVRDATMALYAPCSMSATLCSIARMYVSSQPTAERMSLTSLTSRDELYARGTSMR